MKGSTHLAIGTAIGLIAAVQYPFDLKNDALYVTVAAFSALSADLDGPSLLNGKLGKASKLLRELILWTGALLTGSAAYLYFARDLLNPEFATAAVAILLLGFAAKEGAIRNALMTIIGGGLMYFGWMSHANWLIGFGLFIAWVPWLKHRGMSHTVWALLLWGAIGKGLENQLGLEGIAAVAFAGYFSHLAADTLTPHGVKWVYPLYKKPIKLPLR